MSESADASQQPASRLSRSLGLPDAVVVGVSAMVGMGVFVVWTPVAQLISGQWLLVALGIATAVAALNASTVAHLARRFPEAGGAYAYGRHMLGRGAGVVAGWAFLVGKTGSAVAAALAIGAYVWPAQQRLFALAVIGLALAIDAAGIVRSVRTLAVISAVVVGALLTWAGAVASRVPATDISAAVNVEPSVDVTSVLAAAGLLFVAFAGYARLATLGEEVRDPGATIPGAMAIALIIVTTLYVGLAIVLAPRMASLSSDASLRTLASLTDLPWLGTAVAVSAALAAGGTVLSLIAGMSRTLFAMAAAGDAPRALAAVHPRRRVPRRAQMVITAAVMIITVIGGIAPALTISAVSVLIYYAVAHLSAWRRPQDGSRALPRVVPALGFIGCVALPLALLASLRAL